MARVWSLNPSPKYKRPWYQNFDDRKAADWERRRLSDVADALRAEDAAREAARNVSMASTATVAESTVRELQMGAAEGVVTGQKYADAVRRRTEQLPASIVPAAPAQASGQLAFNFGGAADGGSMAYTVQQKLFADAPIKPKPAPAAASKVVVRPGGVQIGPQSVGDWGARTGRKIGGVGKRIGGFFRGERKVVNQAATKTTEMVQQTLPGLAEVGKVVNNEVQEKAVKAATSGGKLGHWGTIGVGAAVLGTIGLVSYLNSSKHGRDNRENYRYR